LPRIYGTSILTKNEKQTSLNGQSIRIGIVQPNIDPFDKWQTSGLQQIELHHQLTNEFVKQNIDLVIWSETAIPFYILDQPYQMYFQKIKLRFDTLGVPLLTGIPDLIYYKEGDVSPKSSKFAPSGLRYDTYNSSMLLIPASNMIQKYAKVILVPFAERVPFSEELSFLNAMQWNFGLGGWGRGKDTTVFTFQTSKSVEVKFSNMICYESIYPGFVAAFVRKGAQFLTVITNDSWWGNTSGPYQHVQHGVLRAVENRRWIAQCANGGISCFIDPYGRIFKSTDMYAQTVISAEIEQKNELTFYTLRGDWFAEIMLMFSLFFLTAAFGKKLYSRIRIKEQNEIHRSAE
ncbi:MAG TPA: apolipoprotein N-acyltransferase, partial [Bacteroidota bacterium]|nr:apolipoprotein N-acyltransferase [Bacteroidota bacterium]